MELTRMNFPTKLTPFSREELWSPVVFYIPLYWFVIAKWQRRFQHRNNVRTRTVLSAMWTVVRAKQSYRSTDQYRRDLEQRACLSHAHARVHVASGSIKWIVLNKRLWMIVVHKSSRHRNRPWPSEWRIAGDPSSKHGSIEIAQRSLLIKLKNWLSRC